jgi:hypothetical protein
MNKPTSHQRRAALEKARRTLNNINMKKLQADILRKVVPKVEANDTVRFRSFVAAHSRFVRNS